MLLQWRSGGCFVHDMPMISRSAQNCDVSMWWAEGSFAHLNLLPAHIPFCTMYCSGVLDLMTARLQVSAQTR
jgi:hypothetical protein